MAEFVNDAKKQCNRLQALKNACKHNLVTFPLTET